MYISPQSGTVPTFNTLQSLWGGGGHFNGLKAGIRTVCDVHKLKIKLEPEPFIIEPESHFLNLHSKIGVA